MGKQKKKNISDKVRNKRKESERKINPFEVKINRQKHDVLGRKISKHDRGMPGLSRSKAIKKRKATLLQEYGQRLKSNKFVDKRFGEHDATLSVEDKMMKRFALERAKGDKVNKYSLNDNEEELTHYGQSLSEIEKFDNPDISDEDDEDQGRIDGKLVSQEHFGGFLENSNYVSVGGGDNKSWKERMEELITKSKKEKHERQMEKEKSLQLTQQLDDDWKSLRFLMASGRNKEDDTVKPKKDDYDIAVRELQFEMKSKPTDRLKTEEELAKEEKERLEKQESDRLKRMQGILEDDEHRSTHLSADDLNDGFALDYKEETIEASDGDEEDKDQQGSGEDEGDGEDNDEIDEEKEEENDEEEDGEKEEIEEEQSEDGDDSDDSYGDLESEDQGSDVEEEDKQKPTLDLKKKKKVMEEARKELPYTFKAPENYEDLLELLQTQTESDQLIIIDRIIKCHHPSLAEGNKQKLESLFSFLVQYYGDLTLQEPPCLSLADKLVPVLYGLTQQSSVPAAIAVLDQIKDRQEEYDTICDKKAGRGLYPGLDTLLLLKLVAVLFPTSDFRHPVTTPTMLFICQMLAQTPVNHERDVAVGLFLCNLCLEYIYLSRRFVPEAINFLHGLLYLASKKDPNKIEPVIPPFKPVGKSINLLEIKKPVKKKIQTQLKMSEVLTTDMDRDALNNDGFRLSVISSTVVLLEQFSAVYDNYPSYQEIFSPIKCQCGKLPVSNYPESLQKQIQRLVNNITDGMETKRKPLLMQKKKPPPLKMFEPKIEEVFDDRKKRKGGSKEINEKQKLVHKYKKEMKGAIREIRKDSYMIAQVQFQEQKEKDDERKRKVKQLYGLLANQEGDYRAMKRNKSHNGNKEK
ncbi:nucleolar protein 14-like isoform X2 [Mytilus edulis]|uniref:nucleolar protein 14-like isoform X2 n=1 Tax=Mytilus edulis TaxID=6550 RepID=UPI0039EF8EC8